MALGRVGGRVPTAGLLLAGFAVSALLNAGTALVMALSAQVRQMQFWLLGSLELTTPGQLAWSPRRWPWAGVLQVLAWDLNVLLLGDEHAAYLGRARGPRPLGRVAGRVAADRPGRLDQRPDRLCGADRAAHRPAAIWGKPPSAAAGLGPAGRRVPARGDTLVRMALYLPSARAPNCPWA